MESHLEFVNELHKFFKLTEANVDEKERATKIFRPNEHYGDLQRELQQRFYDLFGPIED